MKDGQTILSNLVASQIDLHKEFGGVVPEVAARSHIETILPVVEKALIEAFSVESSGQKVAGKKAEFKTRSTRYPLPATQSAWERIDGIAVTYGPGLPGALLVGALTARTLALIKKKPLYALNHVEAHVYAAFLGESRRNTVGSNQQGGTSTPVYGLRSTVQSKPAFPVLALIVSGGHTQLVFFRHHFDYELLGQTLDDAAGEAFDKVARILGLRPSGASLAHAGEAGNSSRYKFPFPKTSGEYDFSFSGLKTAVLRHLQKLVNKDYSFPSFELSPLLSKQQINDCSASFEHAVVDYLVTKTVKAALEYNPASIVLAGGVAANEKLRNMFHNTFGDKLIIPPPNLCTDNAAMVASLGYFLAQTGSSADPLTLETNPSLSM